MKKKADSSRQLPIEECFFCKKTPALIYSDLEVTMYGDQLQNGNMAVMENLKIKVPRCKRCMNKMDPDWPKIFKRRSYIIAVITSSIIYGALFYCFYKFPTVISRDDAFIIWLCPVTLITGMALADLISGYILLKGMKSFWSNLPDIKNFSKITKLLGNGWRLQN
ncbi:MAG: hypothetical protein ACMUIP_14790 [bacterium]